MKNFKTKLQALRQKAEQFKQVVESAPARAERLRGAVHSAAGQFQQLRSEVQGTVSALRMNDDTQLAAALVEINDSESVFLDAGYHLIEVDMEPGMAPRLLVHFEKLEDVRESELKRLQQNNQSRPTLYAILSAMLKAETTAASVRLSDLAYRRLVVHVGPIPSVQIGWRRVEEEEAAPAAASTVPADSAPAPAPPPLLGGTPAISIFDRPVADDAPSVSSAPPAPAPVPARTTAIPSVTIRPTPALTPLRVARITLSQPSSRTYSQSQSSTEATGDWRKNALVKFKQMPDLTR
jgi:hypothetical protein